MKTVEDSIRRSRKLLLERVWPVIKDWIGGGELIPIEGVTDSNIAMMLDTKAGVDAWQLRQDQGVVGIASRVQAEASALNQRGEPWNTFTIRSRVSSGARTELHKLRTNIEDGRVIRPYWIIQAYFDRWEYPNTLLSVGVAWPEHILACLVPDRKHPDQPLELTNPQDGNRFVQARWDAMAKRDMRIRYEDFSRPSFSQMTLWASTPVAL